jgi:hypothetical protein
MRKGSKINETEINEAETLRKAMYAKYSGGGDMYTH